MTYMVPRLDNTAWVPERENNPYILFYLRVKHLWAFDIYYQKKKTWDTYIPTPLAQNKPEMKKKDKEVNSSNIKLVM